MGEQSAQADDRPYVKEIYFVEQGVSPIIKEEVYQWSYMN